MTMAIYPHIETRMGAEFIVGTTTKVVEIILDRIAHQWDAEEIQRQHPHLSLAQIYSALAFNHDHKLEMDAEIEDRLTKVDQIADSQPPSAVRAKLRALRSAP